MNALYLLSFRDLQGRQHVPALKSMSSDNGINDLSAKLKAGAIFLPSYHTHVSLGYIMGMPSNVSQILTKVNHSNKTYKT